MTAERRPSRAADVLRTVGGVGIIIIAVMRCVIAFMPQVVFDVDPVRDPHVFAGLGPAGSLTLDVLLLLCCAMAFVGIAIGKERINWLYVLLALLPLPGVLVHGLSDAGDLASGVSWASAALACVTISHVARRRALRLVMIAMLLAVVGPLLVRGIANMSYEFQGTVDQFEQQKELIFREKGWDTDSPNARIFERRVLQNQPTGWFMTTNVYGSFMVVSMAFFTALAIGAARARLTSGWTGGAVLLALLSGAGLLATGSKGAFVMGMCALVLVLVPLLSRGMNSLFQRHGPRVLLACVGLAILGVVVRGAILPEGMAGEKSVLFRWHYMIGAARTMQDNPLTGVGADHFQQAYMVHRPLRSPEEVASTHNVFLDWITSHGVLGAAWVILVLMLLWRCGTALRESTEPDEPDSPGRLPVLAGLGILGAVVLGLLPAMLIEFRALAETGLALRIVGIVTFLFTAWLIYGIVAVIDRPVLGWALAVAGCALLMHGQIELTFVQPGSVVWVMCLLGIAAPTPPGRWEGRRAGVLSTLAGLMCAALACVVLMIGVIPAWKQQARMVDAAQLLFPLAELKPHEISREQVIALRVEASEQLMEAHAAMPMSYRPALAAAHQQELAYRLAPDEERAAHLAAALDCLERAGLDKHYQLWDFAFLMHGGLATWTGDEQHLHEAEALARRMTAANPHGVAVWVRLGDTLWRQQQFDAAAAAYSQALQNNANFELDAMKQVPATTRTRLEQRIDEAAGVGSE